MITGNEPINVIPYRDKAIETENGLTIRQYYAGLAMKGILSNSNETICNNITVNDGWQEPNTIAKISVQMADALIAELNKEKP